MADVMHRSQAILRMPVDYVDATLILHDGERSDVIFFVSPDDDLATIVTSGDPFIPVMCRAKIRIIARQAIAAVGHLPSTVAPEDELPSEHQLATVKLKSGMMMEGELRWTTVSGEQRTADHLNTEAPYFLLRAVDRTYIINKAHVAYVQEL